ncbi:hypothetical protein BDV37DRAFT_177674 [Aspergillus pseudonomiae]|uniref:Secreted protein n=1 Tax=Aspergillus pseudonomiae TaxID=1506151 RepID=A0A5N7D533_9EURO|nr:uncharacterized protein BDV37DRAFT_177674 [Aspergillus pseudonomiae]KAE8401522.1 hypothetical protein BDV37DRAFT_177674 [Aspergillus pseudonomiae]
MLFIYSLSLACSTALGSSCLPSPARVPSFYPPPQVRDLYLTAWGQRNLTKGLGKSQSPKVLRTQIFIISLRSKQSPL